MTEELTAERLEGKPPNGDYSIAYYYNDDFESAPKRLATRVEIVDFAVVPGGPDRAVFHAHGYLNAPTRPD